MLDPHQFDLLLEERRHAVEEYVDTQRKLRLLAPARPHPGRRCCAWIGARLQEWGLKLQTYAAQNHPHGWEEQLS